MNIKGVASAFVFMMAISMFRMGQKSTWATDIERQGTLEHLQSDMRKEFKANRGKVGKFMGRGSGK